MLLSEWGWELRRPEAVMLSESAFGSAVDTVTGVLSPQRAPNPLQKKLRLPKRLLRKWQ